VDADLGRILWGAVVASLEGDGVEPPQGLASLVRESAGRLGIEAPAIMTPKQPSNFSSDRGTYALDIPGSYGPYLAPVFRRNATPFQIITGLKKWHDTRGPRPSVQGVVNAVGWRLIDMVEGGEERTAEAILQRIARDVRSWDDNTLIPSLAKGLANRGIKTLAAMAGTYALTRAYETSFRFGGPKGEALFRESVQLDPSVAWSVLAEEVAWRRERNYPDCHSTPCS
jgi:hypothetical protein